MPKNSSIDIPHVAVTDHFIRRRPQDDKNASKIEAFLGLKSFNNAHPDPITIGRAYLEFYERFNKSAFLLDSALYYLSLSEKEEKAKYLQKHLIRAYFLKKDYEKVIQLTEGIALHEVNDAWMAYHVSESLDQVGKLAEAMRWAERGKSLLPESPDFINHYAALLLKNKKWDEAKKSLLLLTSKYPNHSEAWLNLGYAQMQTGAFSKAQSSLEKSLQLNPDAEQAIFNLAILYRQQGREDLSKAVLKKLLYRFPQNVRARQMMKDIGG